MHSDIFVYLPCLSMTKRKKLGTVMYDERLCMIKIYN